MILDRSVFRDVEEFLGHEQRDERHHLKVRRQKSKFLPHLLLAIGGGLYDGNARRDGSFLQRIGLRTRFLGRDINRNDVVAAPDERIEHRFAKGLLAVDDNSHDLPSPYLLPPPLVGG